MRAISIVLFAAGCSVSSPHGVLGVKWGEDVAAVAQQLRVSCSAWRPWFGGESFEVCADLDHPVDAFGHPALVELVRRGGQLEGVSLRYRDGGAVRGSLRDTVRREYKLDSGDGDPYHTWHDGSLVVLQYDHSDDSCTITVAGPRLGPPLAAQLLKQGLGQLGGATRPH